MYNAFLHQTDIASSTRPVVVYSRPVLILIGYRVLFILLVLLEFYLMCTNNLGHLITSAQTKLCIIKQSYLLKMVKTGAYHVALALTVYGWSLAAQMHSSNYGRYSCALRNKFDTSCVVCY